MDESKLTDLVKRTSKFIVLAAEKFKSELPAVFTSQGRWTGGVLKEWYGTATSVNGVFVLDISSAKFAQIFHIDPQPIYNSSDFNLQVFASINLVSLNSITGRVSRGATGIFKSEALLPAPNCTVMVKVTGK